MFIIYVHFIAAEVLRLFAPYSRGRLLKRPNTAAGPSAKRHRSVSYTHRFFCLSKRKESEVPSPTIKNKLERARFGEKRIIFPGNSFFFSAHNAVTGLKQTQGDTKYICSSKCNSACPEENFTAQSMLFYSSGDKFEILI